MFLKDFYMIQSIECNWC